MPTGYTTKLYEGEQTFEGFVLMCSRAFGANVTMRDEPLSVLPPITYEPSPYHKIQADLEEQRYNELLNADKAAYNIKEYDVALARYEQRNEEKTALKARYTDMLDAVIDWNVPQELYDFKDFMIKQLQESIWFDCYDINPPDPNENYYEKDLKNALGDIKYHKEEYQKEVQRVNARNEWLRTLRNALNVRHSN